MGLNRPDCRMRRQRCEHGGRRATRALENVADAPAKTGNVVIT